MKKLLVYLKDYKKESVLAPLFKMLEASFELIVPLVVTAIIDVGIADRNSGYILKMCLVMVALGLIGLVCSVTAQYFAAKAAAGFGTRVRHQLFAHIQTFSFTEIDQAGTSTLITRMTSDINQVQSGVNMVLRLFLRSPFIVFGSMIMAFTIDVKAALIFVVAIPLLSLVVFGVMAVSIPLYRNVQERLDKVLGITRENLTGARVIRAFHKEEEEKARFEEGLESLTSMQNHVGRISAFMNPVTFVIINGATIFLLYTGAVQVDTGVLTQGEVVALVNYMSQILVELIKLADLIVTITKAVACGNRVESVLEIQSSMPADGAGKRTGSERCETKMPAVQFSHVGLTYRGAGGESLSDIDFSAERGETIGIIGGTGSGKTSLVHLIPRFYDVTGGTVKIDGQDIREVTLKSLRSQIGIVQQDVYLFVGTVMDNIRYGRPDATPEEVVQAAKNANAHEFIMALPDGYDTDIGQRGVKLSGGQKQRLSIARVFLKNPPILIFDEATSALDNESEKVVQESLEKLAKNRTTFVIAHRLSTIRNAQKILVLTDSGIEEEGTHKELLEKEGIYARLYSMQFAG